MSTGTNKGERGVNTQIERDEMCSTATSGSSCRGEVAVRRCGRQSNWESESERNERGEGSKGDVCGPRRADYKGSAAVFKLAAIAPPHTYQGNETSKAMIEVQTREKPLSIERDTVKGVRQQPTTPIDGRVLVPQSPGSKLHCPRLQCTCNRKE